MSETIKEYSQKKVCEVLAEKVPKKVGLFFWHGLGDCLMFVKPFNELRRLFPDIEIDLLLQKGMGQEAVFPGAVFVGGESEAEGLGYEYIFHIHFPMSEGDKVVVPKAEKCCSVELGIPPISGHPILDTKSLKLVGFSFNATALPGPAGCQEDVANKIWEEAKAAGYKPIEIMMEHAYHNPENSQFPFVDLSLRKVGVDLEFMIGTIKLLTAFVGVSSGPIHLALSLLPTSRVGYLEKNFPLISITRDPVKVFNVREYKEGEMKRWLENLAL